MPKSTRTAFLRGRRARSSQAMKRAKQKDRGDAPRMRDKTPCFKSRRLAEDKENFPQKIEVPNLPAPEHNDLSPNRSSTSNAPKDRKGPSSDAFHCSSFNRNDFQRNLHQARRAARCIHSDKTMRVSHATMKRCSNLPQDVTPIHAVKLDFSSPRMLNEERKC